MASRYMHSGSSSPPALYDTSTSTADDSMDRKNSFYPKSHPHRPRNSRRHEYPTQQCASQQPPVLSEAGVSWTSAKVEFTQLVQGYPCPTSQHGGVQSIEEEPVARSEPGTREDRLAAAYLHRYSQMDHQRSSRSRSSQDQHKTVYSQVRGQFSKKSGIREQPRHPFPDPEPDMDDIEVRSGDGEPMPVFEPLTKPSRRESLHPREEQRSHSRESSLERRSHRAVSSTTNDKQRHYESTPHHEARSRESSLERSQQPSSRGSSHPREEQRSHSREPSVERRSNRAVSSPKSDKQHHYGSTPYREASSRESSLERTQQQRQSSRRGVSPETRYSTGSESAKEARTRDLTRRQHQRRGVSPETRYSTGSESGAHEPQATSHRTRDLARRFEQRQASRAAAGASAVASHRYKKPVQPPRESSMSPSPQVQRPSRSEQQQQDEEEPVRPTSLPPGRRMRPMQQPAPADRRESPSESQNLNELASRERFYSERQQEQEQPRAEIETPAPVKVRDIRRKLWDPNESLQVAVKPSVHDSHDNDRFNRHWLHYNGPEMHGHLELQQQQQQQQQRQARSLSPKASRRRMDELESSKLAAGIGEGKLSNKLFKSRYYQAAQRSVNSPDRSNSTGDRRTLGSYSHKSMPAAESARHLYTNLSEEEKEETLRAIKTRYQAVVETASNMDTGATNSASSKPDKASLVAKLAAIDRGDPAEALAQIDAILRAESRSISEDPASTVRGRDSTRDDSHPAGSGGQAPLTEANLQTPQAQDEEEDEVDSDEETSVSSITNPTYQAPETEAAVTAASKGLPRPSALQSYTNPSNKRTPAGVATKDTSKKSRSKKARSPPPASIQMSSKREKSRKEESANSDTVEPAPKGEKDPYAFQSLDEKEVDPDSTTEPSYKVHVWDDVGSPKQPPKSPGVHSTNPFDNDNDDEKKMQNKTNPFEKTNGAITRDRAIPFDEEKKQDSTSTIPFDEKNEKKGDVSPPPKLTSKLTPRSITPTKSRRPHPWDPSVPASLGKVNLKDTSMDQGFGIETRFTPRYDSGPAESPQRSEDDLAATTRRMRMERISRGVEEKKKNGDEEIKEEPQASNPFNGDDFDVHPKLMTTSDDDGWGVMPTCTRRHQDNAKTMSDDFDSAWVALPSSAFFQGKPSPDLSESRASGVDSTRQAPTRISVTSKRDSSDDVIFQEPDLPSKIKREENVQTFSPEIEKATRPTPEPASPAKRVPATNDHSATAYDDGRVDASTDEELGGIEVSLVDPPSKPSRTEPVEEKGRRGFKRLLKGRNSTKTSSEFAASSSHSRRPKEEPLLAARSRDVDRRGRRTSKSPGRRTSKSPSTGRDRPRSLDERRIRNPKIAKKFSRMMKLYDVDDRDQVGYI